MEPDPNAPPASPAVAPPVATPPGEPVFSKADIEAAAAKARERAEQETVKKVLADLGVGDLDAAKALLEAQRAAEEAAKSELQKAQDAATKAMAEADQAKAQARNTVVVAEVRSALRDAGINPARLDGAMRLADLAGLSLDADGAVQGLEAAVASVKQASPEWFGAPGKPFSAPDASGSSSGVDYRTASPEERASMLRALNLSPAVAGFAY